MAISIQQKKTINSLKLKKYRTQLSAYVVEGDKNVLELILAKKPIEQIYAVEKWITDNKTLIDKKKVPYTLVSEKELKSISSLSTPNQVLAVARIEESDFNKEPLKKEKILMLDSIRDPGNFGTIVRTANWFGIRNILASHDCVDIYNQKTIQATMGSFAKVNVHYCNLQDMLKEASDVNIYAAVLDGKDISENTFTTNTGILILGNEAKGISENILKLVTHKIKIPNYTNLDKTQLAESLNVSVACGVLLYEFCKK